MNTITANVPLLGGVFDIAIADEKISSVTESDKTTDLFAGPTLFDIQVNGYGGRTCRIGSEKEIGVLAYITRIFRSNGIGWWIPTITSSSPEVLAAAFKYCGAELDGDADTSASIPGLHLEGPYISPIDGPRGAHVLKDVRPPDWDEFQKLQEACGGRILYVTVAPEVDGCIDFIRKCVASGVVVSMGHTNLDRDDLARAVDAGASMATHLGNGAHDMIQRHNNYIWYLLANRRCYASFVADGHHLPQECLYSLIHAKGLDLSIITSDCITLGGMKPGIYQVRDREIEKLPSGRINLRGTKNLAGGASNQRECTETVIRLAKLSHARGWATASTNPAKMLGLDDRLGIEAGKEASITVYKYSEAGPKISVVETWVAGRKVYDAATTEPIVLPETPLTFGVV
ncbi:MAG: N-acetylglucosamine-6-phosphate deacetylase [Planctomycetes bacterium]|nr:N-acetylglucosamine-6-phosphate deacetylase [Planctomycetota bacterium]